MSPFFSEVDHRQIPDSSRCNERRKRDLFMNEGEITLDIQSMGHSQTLNLHDFSFYNARMKMNK